MNRPMDAENGGRSCGRDRAAIALGAMLVLLFLAVFPADAGAIQWNATVRGKVTDVDGNPLRGVKVTVEPLFQNRDNPVAPIVVETNDDGQFQARNVRLGDTTITFVFEGYETVVRQRPLRAGPVRINVTLEAVTVPDAVLQANIANEAYQAGREAFNAGTYGEVVSQMQAATEALEGTPDNAESLGYLYALMGRAYLEQRMFQQAAEAYRKWVEYHPDQTGPLIELAQALSESGDPEGATTYFEAALALQPDDAMTRYNMGVIMVNVGNLEDGIRKLEEAIELQPEYPLAYKNLGYAYARTEDYAEAIEAFDKYIEQSPDAEDTAQIQDFIVALKEIIG
ncbi:MAG: tetratricopeptide repeat protein [Acidobacteria bacterium]|nr:tetratricopeptide repeat protein [Acidobacteriota bacterium]